MLALPLFTPHQHHRTESHSNIQLRTQQVIMFNCHHCCVQIIYLRRAQLCMCKQRESFIFQKNMLKKIYPNEKNKSIQIVMMEILLKKNLNLYCNRMLHKCKKWSSNCCTLFSKVFKTFSIPNSFVWPSVDWKININFSNWRIKWGQMSGKVGCSAKSPSRVKVSKTVG